MSRILPASIAGCLFLTGTGAPSFNLFAASPAFVTTPGRPGDPIAAVRQAISARDPMAQQRLMIGLRGLSDPMLVPLFSQVAEFGVGGSRLQAILALAELNPAQGLDLLLVRRLSTVDQAVVLGEALRDGLLSPDTLADIARWPDLDPLMLVSASARLASMGKPVDRERLGAIASGIDTPGPMRPVAVLAMATLAQTDPTDELLKEHLAAVDASINPSRPAAATNPVNRPARPPVLDAAEVRAVLLGLRQLRLSRAAQVVDSVLARPDLDNLTRAECVATLIELEPASNRTLTAWLDAFNRGGADRGDHLRLGMHALRLSTSMTAGPAIRPDRNALVMAERLGSRRDELLSAMGAAVGSLTTTAGTLPNAVLSPQTAAAINNLVKLRHGASALWAAEFTATRDPAVPSATATPPAPAIPTCDASISAIRLALIEASATAPATKADAQLDEAAVRAAQGLLRCDPAAVLLTMQRATFRKDEKTVRLLLTGGLRLTAEQLAREYETIAAFTAAAVRTSSIAPGDTPSPDAAPAGEAFGPPPSPVAAMATLLNYRARAAAGAATVGPEPFAATEAEQEALARLAEPDSPLSEPARIQAAWMTIRARQQERLALTQILAEVAPQSGPDSR